jgi:hypothetical protein
VIGFCDERRHLVAGRHKLFLPDEDERHDCQEYLQPHGDANDEDDFVRHGILAGVLYDWETENKLLLYRLRMLCVVILSVIL